MKQAWVYLFAIMVCAQALGQQGNAPAPLTMHFETGAIANGVYSNECLGLSFTIPSGWEINSQVVGADGKARAIPSGLALLVLRQEKDHSTNASIALLANNAANSKKTAQDFVTTYVHSQISAHPEGRQLVKDATAVDYGGAHFFRADYKQTAGNGGKTLNLAIVYTKYRDFFVGETIMATTPEEVNQAADSLRGISFKEDKSNPNCALASAETPAPAAAAPPK